MFSTERLIERRYTAGGFGGGSVRAENGDPGRRVSGYFAHYNRMSPTYGNFRERIAPGFFEPAIGRDDVLALFNHDDSRILGRTSAGTLRLRSDANGLFGEIEPVPDTPTGSEVVENLKLKNLKGASFSFTLAPKGDAWVKASDGVWERTLLKIGELFDTSVVSRPFYPSTDVGLRIMEQELEQAFGRRKGYSAREYPSELDAMRLRLAGL
jgi:hypothetical protein